MTTELRHRAADVWDLLDTIARAAGEDTVQFVDDLLDPRWNWLMHALMEYRLPPVTPPSVPTKSPTPDLSSGTPSPPVEETR